MGYHWVLLLLTGAWLNDLVSCDETKNLCDVSKGFIESITDEKQTYKLKSDNCRSGPNALFLNFVLRNSECTGHRSCRASATIKIGERLFDACDDKMYRIRCYAILTTNFPLDLIPDTRCSNTLIHRVETMPTVTFEFQVCKSSSKFNLTYEHIIKQSEPTSTETDKVEQFSTVATKSKATESTSDSYTIDTTNLHVTTTTEPYVTTTTEPYVTTSTEPYVTTTKSVGNPCATSMPLQPLPQRDSSATVAAIILGILLIISLLALGILAIRHHRVMASQKLESDSRGVGEGTNGSGDVIVNEVYNSFGDNNAGGEVVVNELYGHRQ